MNIPTETKSGLWYLASPYSKYPLGIEQAFIDVSVIAAELMKAGVHVYVPISHSHPIAIYGGIDPLSHDIWLPLDNKLMEACDGIIVALMEGWETSFGVKHEVDMFVKMEKPVHLLKVGGVL